MLWCSCYCWILACLKIFGQSPPNRFTAQLDDSRCWLTHKMKITLFVSLTYTGSWIGFGGLSGPEFITLHLWKGFITACAASYITRSKYGSASKSLLYLAASSKLHVQGFLCPGVVHNEKPATDRYRICFDKTDQDMNSTWHTKLDFKTSTVEPSDNHLFNINLHIRIYSKNQIWTSTSTYYRPFKHTSVTITQTASFL